MELRVVRRELETSLDDLPGPVVGVRHQVGVGQEAVLAHLAGRGRETPLVDRDRQLRLLQPGPRRDELVVRLVVAGVEVDRPLVLVDRAPELDPPVTLQQVAVPGQRLRVGGIGDRLLVQRLCREEVALVAEGLVPLEKVVLVHN